MTLKVRILVILMMTWFSEKMLISTRCIHDFLSNLIKNSWTDSNQKLFDHIGIDFNFGSVIEFQLFFPKDFQMIFVTPLLVQILIFSPFLLPRNLFFSIQDSSQNWLKSFYVGKVKFIYFEKATNFAKSSPYSWLNVL